MTNFKSIKHLEINDCNKINVFIGMPNAGKSNILEALGLFGLILDNKNSLIDKLIRFKLNSELFFEENTSDEIGLKINNTNINITLNEFKQRSKPYSSLNEQLIYYTTNMPSSIKWQNEGYEFRLLEDDELSLIKKYQFQQTEFIKSGNKNSLLYPDGANLVEIISSNPELRKIVNDLFFNNNLKLLIEKNTNELRIFKEYQDGTVFTLPYELIADTLQRLIFYKAAIMSNKDAVLLFEEPEAHCFEPYILEFANAVKYDKNDNQFFIVTHSDYIIKEFLRDEESKENTNIYLVNNVDGETKVKLLDKKNNEDVFEFGMNIFFNFESLWETN